MAGKKKTAALKVKKKRWIPVIAPKIFRNLQVGESHVLEPENLVGRKMKINLMSLTNDIKKQNVLVNLEVTEIKNASAQTKVIGYSMIPAAIKRLVRRNRNKLDDSFICETANNVNIRVKPLMLTRNKARSASTTQLINANREKVAQYMKKTNFDTFLTEVISTRFQRAMKEQLSKIYPLRIYEMRAFKIETGKIKKSSKVFVTEDKPPKKEETKESEPVKEVKEEEPQESK
ncbi:MAG: hypothetical protein U9R08_05120 [Nanoarchaeota archaeon]|nr:hypothetical protein [Nanoarchaeota archaeon]